MPYGWPEAQVGDILHRREGLAAGLRRGIRRRTRRRIRGGGGGDDAAARWGDAVRDRLAPLGNSFTTLPVPVAIRYLPAGLPAPVFDSE
jgi:hypothetical protein